MTIAVVIPALDEADRIRAAIESARAPEVEILVVDGGSRDATPERAREAGVRVIQSEPGRARQLAAGVREVGADTLLFLHADTRLPPGWSERVAAALADPRVVGGAFALRFDRAALAGVGAGARALLLAVEAVARARGRWLGLPYGDQALFVRTRALAAAGGVPQVPILEDLDLVARLRRVGRLVVLPEGVATSPRRHLEGGVLRTALRHAAVLVAWRLGVDRARIARCAGRGAP